MTIAEQNVVDNIKKFGWIVTTVMDRIDEPTDEPNFAYSTGLYETFNKPEILIVGLKPDLSHILINNIGYDYKNKRQFQIGKLHDGILDKFDCLLIDVEKKYYKNYFGQSLWYYQNEGFPVTQIIYPTINGFFPWDDAFPKNLKQPILNEKYQNGISN